MMNREEAENYVYKSYLKAEQYQRYDSKDAQKRHPEYSRSIIQELCSASCIVVTGSKGKGSVANMIASVLSTKHAVGLMTSPHIADFCERFKVGGEDISSDEFCDIIAELAPMFDRIDADIPRDCCVSPMGIQAALALKFFSRHSTDFNVMECGKGAKYDDVNNVAHDYAVINSIFLEHTRELGDTIERIAEDKSCVITGDQKCVYVAQQHPSVLRVLQERASLCNTPMKVYGHDFLATNIRYTDKGMLFDVVIGNDCYNDIRIPLMGEHQARNCALAMAVCRDVMGDDFSLEDIKKALDVIKWRGRMEIISSSPFVLLDACINKESCVNVREVLGFLGIKRYCLIVGIPDDKDFSGVVEGMKGGADCVIMTKSQNAHYVFTEKQIDILADLGIKAQWASDVKTAFSIAFSYGLPVVALGTTSFITEVSGLSFPVFGRTDADVLTEVFTHE